ncbi:MAG: serine protease [Lachnospiraceae bacterium]|nr:serine protease [Lachnospiraceae bacterium]
MIRVQTYRLRAAVLIVLLSILLTSCGREKSADGAAQPEIGEKKEQSADIGAKQADKRPGAELTTHDTDVELPLSLTVTQETRRDGPESFPDSPQRIEQAAASVVKLEAFNHSGDRIGTGSGFCIYEPDILVTAAHVIVNAEYLTATCDNGETFRIDRFLNGSEDDDIAICLIPEGVNLTPLPAGSVPQRGERLVVIGSQFGVVNLVTQGNLSGIYRSGSVERLLFTAPVSSGNSGGPVFNSEGAVVGIVSGTYDKGQNLNVASPISLAEVLYKSTITESVR